MVQYKLPCLLDVQLFDLLRGHVQLTHEHRENPCLVLDLLLCVHERGPGNWLTGAQRLPKRGRVNLGYRSARRDDRPRA